MSLRVSIRKSAKKDYRDAALYINKHDKEAAKMFVIALRKTISNLALFPTMGKFTGGDIKVLRFLLIKYSYWVVYTYSNTQIDILRVVHVSKDFNTVAITQD